LQKDYVINNLLGLHVLPSKQIVQIAKEFEGDITLIKGEKRANAKKLIEVLSLGGKKNETVTLITEGNKAEEGQQAIGEILTHGNALHSQS